MANKAEVELENIDAGKWADELTRDELENTKKFARELAKSNEWNNFLSDAKVKNAINSHINNSRTFSQLNTIKSALFEIRFSYLIHQSGLKAEYEFNPNNYYKKTVDFKVLVNENKNINLLIELSSLRESDIQKEKTWKNGDFFGCILVGDDDASAYFKAQKVLIEKASKFPSEKVDDQFNIVIIDMRSTILGCCDCYDYKNILYGSEKLGIEMQRFTKDNKLFPGLFCATHPGNEDADLNHLRSSIHYFGFVVEENYSQNELATKIHWFQNPNLVTRDSPGLDLKKIFKGTSAA